MSDQVCVTVRLIRSFEYKNIHNFVYHAVDIEQNGSLFLSFVKENIKSRKGLPPPVKNHVYDAMKIQHKAHGYKSSDPVINVENDEMFFIDLNKTLKENGVENETEISVFNLGEYRQYQKNPEVKW
ncbi:UPF0538 protein C2orf76-like [Rhopilema esculentum]|uniref:UPF0538 protein C2orf76-like n=1 Tax=Rhopilema esculentum TaxID=499914 RepID=UPI0031E10231